MIQVTLNIYGSAMNILHLLESRSSDFTRRLRRSMEDGIQGVSEEFGVSFNRAIAYIMAHSDGSYGEAEIDDRTLHRLRAPQNILKLLKYFNITPNVSKKLINFHILNKKIIDKHLPSPSNAISIRQLLDNERLVSLIENSDLDLEPHGLAVTKAPWTDVAEYIYYPTNKDVVDELLRFKITTIELDLLHGLSFGYPMSSVFNYVRSKDQQLIDTICTN